MSFADLIATQQRLLALTLLLREPDRAHNERSLQAGLAGFGHGLGRDEVRLLIDWLVKAGLVEVEEVNGLWVATLTGRGAEIARGTTTVPGVQHPSDLV